MMKFTIKIEAEAYKNKKTGCAGKVDIIIDGKTKDAVSYFDRSEGIENEGLYYLILNLTDVAKNHLRDEMKKEFLNREDFDKPSKT